MRPEKTKTDPRGGHIRLYWEVIDSNAWRCLTAADQRCYIALSRGLLSFNNGDLSLPLSVARHHGITSQTTLAKSLRALCAVRLIAITRPGGCKRDGTRMPNLYRFTDHPVHAMPAKLVEAEKATNEWRAVSTLAHGKALIREADRIVKAEWAAQKAAKQAAKLAPVKTQNLVQILTATSPKNGLRPPSTSPEIGLGAH
jgi:hypothetical protein